MRPISNSYRSLNLIWEMHGDTALMALAITVALGLGGGLWTFIVPVG